jgi:hypothetical protein
VTGTTKVVPLVVLAVVAVVAGGVAFAIASDDDPPPTTTTTTAPPTFDEITDAIAAALTDELEVRITTAEADCITDGLVETLGRPTVEALADAGELAASEEQRATLITVVVECLPPDKAGGLLRETPTSTTVGELPGDETDPSASP